MSFHLSDPVGAVLGSALDGIALRQRVIADNIANVDTPHYRASSVDFETNLRAAIGSGTAGSGDALPLAPTLTATNTPVGANGNNVDLRKESLAAIQTQYQFQIMGRAMSDRHNLLKTAAAIQ